MVYVYLVLSSQIKAKSTIAGNSAPAVDAQEVFKDTFNGLIRGDLSTDPEKYQGLLEHGLSKVDFTVGVGIYIYASKEFELKHWEKKKDTKTKF